MGTNLRDALDLSRAGIDEKQVNAVRAEDSGMNVKQVAFSGVILSISVICLIVLPMLSASLEIKGVYFMVNLILIATILGIIFCAQAFASALERFYLKLMMNLIRWDKSMMPIIFKNLESHSLKNLKANLMYCITITFLVYSGSNF